VTKNRRIETDLRQYRQSTTVPASWRESGRATGARTALAASAGASGISIEKRDPSPTVENSSIL
jgi:hypothetical protein